MYDRGLLARTESANAVEDAAPALMDAGREPGRDASEPRTPAPPAADSGQPDRLDDGAKQADGEDAGAIDATEAGGRGGGAAGMPAAGSGGMGGVVAPEDFAPCTEPGAQNFPGNGHCYFLTAEVVSWNNARDLCLERKARLVSIGDAAENEFVGGLLSRPHWTGLARFGTPTFSWHSGEPLTYTNWERGAPNQPADSAGLVRDGSHRWFDAQIGAANPAICERD